VRELALFDVLDPGPKNANRYLVFFFARNCAGVAPDTTVLIYDKTVAHLWNITLMLGIHKDCKPDIISDSCSRQIFSAEKR
jgi:hypothetical protein